MRYICSKKIQKRYLYFLLHTMSQLSFLDFSVTKYKIFSCALDALEIVINNFPGHFNSRQVNTRGTSIRHY